MGLWAIISIFRDQITHLFIINNDMATISALNFALPLLNILLIIMPLGLISVSILQGLQRYKESFIISSLRSVVFEILLGFIAVFMFHNVFAVYIGIIVGGLLGCLLSLYKSQRILNQEIKNVEKC